MSATLSLRARRLPLADPVEQRRTLGRVSLPREFPGALGLHGLWPLRPTRTRIFQINVGKLCNQTCRHCHVDAGPDRVAENMDRATAELCLQALDRSGCHTVDITGGAPELNPNFEFLVEEATRRGLHVIDRCNLTILLLPRFAHLPAAAGDGW